MDRLPSVPGQVRAVGASTNWLDASQSDSKRLARMRNEE